jgi:hypothetical protein
VLPIGICFSLPTVWLNTPTILIAILPLIWLGADTPAGRWLRTPAVALLATLPRVRRRVRWATKVVRRELAEIVETSPARRI